MISYSATATNSDLGEIVRCGVRANGTFLSIHTATVGRNDVNAAFTSTISGVAYYTSSSPYQLDLVCTHDGSGGVPIIDAGAEVAVY
ncbi:hypothetical protein LC607_12445 [Nostoc sp. CHAB 5824]|nr:hypothetical protein [Nostoc sp. CHAB 5824]